MKSRVAREDVLVDMFGRWRWRPVSLEAQPHSEGVQCVSRGIKSSVLACNTAVHSIVVQKVRAGRVEAGRCRCCAAEEIAAVQCRVTVGKARATKVVQLAGGR